MSSPGSIMCCLRALHAKERGVQAPSLRHRPTRCFTSISGSISLMKNGLAAAARPLLLLLLLSQEPAENELFSVKQHERVGFDVSLLPFGSFQRFGVTYAAALHSGQAHGTNNNSSEGKQETEEGILQSRQDPEPRASASPAAAVGFSQRPSGADVGSVGSSNPRAPVNKPVLAYQHSEDKVGAVQGSRGTAEGAAFRDTNGESTLTFRDGGGAETGVSRGSERHRTGAGDPSHVPPRQILLAANAKYSRLMDRRFSKLPPPLPPSRVLPALRSFEHVHGQLTLFFNGFSRGGSVIAYDLLNELRTVSEAKMMMDVEFLVLDRVMEYYGTPTHMRVVDTTVVHQLLDLSNLLPWRIPHLVASIRRLAVEYQPVLREFLNRYEPSIEALVLVKVPPGLKPLRPLLARMFNIPKEKLVLASDLKDLRELIPLKYIPREFGNANGGRVRDGLENRVSWKIMLEEIAEKLGEDAVSPAGKELLKELKEEHRRAVAAAGASKNNKSYRNTTADGKQSKRAAPTAAPMKEFISNYAAAGAVQRGRSNAVLRGDESTWGKHGIPLNRRGNGYQRTSGVQEDIDNEELGLVGSLEDISDEESDFIE